MTPSQMAILHAASFARGWSEKEFIDLLAKPTCRAITTDSGFALLQLLPPESELLTIVIDPARRGKGCGRALLTETLRTAGQNGADTLFLEVDATNHAARALYANAGFAQTGLRTDYYTHPDGSKSDALIMS